MKKIEMRYMGLGLEEEKRGGKELHSERKASSSSCSPGYFGVSVCLCVCEKER